ITAHLIYEGTIQRESLVALIEKLNIPIKPAKEYPIKAEEKIVIVDGCKGNKNVTDLIGDEVAVIDHHEVTSPEDVPFSDIRPEYGACSTLIFHYYKELNRPIPPHICTALLCGLNVDTLQLSRGVNEADVEAYAGLYTGANVNFVNSILRNSIQVKDLDFYKSALNRVKIRDGFAFCYFKEGCNQNLMGILGDFFLTLQEVDFVFLCALNNNVVNFSLRSEVAKWNSALIIQAMLKGIGFGGGHADMAGGIIKDLSLFNEQDIFKRLVELLL
ncbi:MAG: DHH family phosphoesterase, partial [Spirochaetales bacterium]|nr:DHH family phosphoesterase [Spirochaetales bacterium]